MINKDKVLNILVVGTGMYTCGRDTAEFGTIIPALCEWLKGHPDTKIFLAGRSKEGVRSAKLKIDILKRRTGVNFNIEYFSLHNTSSENYKEAINKIPKPACVIVAVPDNLHYQIASYAIKHDLHTLVVKPLVPSLREARKLLLAQQKKKVYCAVEFHKRLDLANLKLKDTIKQGLIGDPLYFLVEYSQRKTIPVKAFKAWAGKTNIFQYLGVHYADIIYFATDALPVRAMACGQKNWLVKQGINTFDSMEVVVEWKGANGKKFVSHFLTNWIDPESTSSISDQRIKLIGTSGRFESDQKNRGIKIVTDKNGIQEPNPYFCAEYSKNNYAYYQGYGIDSICNFLDDCAAVAKGTVKIKELENQRPTFRQALVSTAIIEAVNSSLRKNASWVKIKGLSAI